MPASVGRPGDQACLPKILDLSRKNVREYDG